MGFVELSMSWMLIGFGVALGVALLIILPFAAKWERAAHKDTEIRELRAQLASARHYISVYRAIAEEAITMTEKLNKRGRNE